MSSSKQLKMRGRYLEPSNKKTPLLFQKSGGANIL